MKNLLLCLLALSTFNLNAQAPPKLFIYIDSHNEDNIGYLNGQGGYLNYESSRTALVNFANMVQAKGIAYNYGADHVALQAIAKYDTGSSIVNTNSKNLVKWMTEDKGIVCDAHSHESTYNYADVAYLMSQLGVTPTNTMNGFLFDQPQNGHNWEDYQNGVAGDSFPQFTWHPEILWGAGTPNHQNDPQYYGVYKPKSMAEFNVHEPNNYLILCGTGCTLKVNDTSTVAYKWAQIKSIVNAIQTGAVPSNGLYTQEIFFSEQDAKAPWFYSFMDQLTDSVNALVDSGFVEWKHIGEIVDYWKTTYGEQPFAMDCGHNVFLQPTAVDQVTQSNDILLYPDPFSDQLSIYASGLFGKNEGELRALDITGKEIYRKYLQNGSIFLDTENWSNGIYIIEIIQDSKYSMSKVVKQ